MQKRKSLPFVPHGATNFLPSREVRYQSEAKSVLNRVYHTLPQSSVPQLHSQRHVSKVKKVLCNLNMQTDASTEGCPLKTDNRCMQEGHCQRQLPLSSLKVERLSWYGLGTFTPTFQSLSCRKVMCRLVKGKHRYNTFDTQSALLAGCGLNLQQEKPNNV